MLAEPQTRKEELMSDSNEDLQQAVGKKGRPTPPRKVQEAARHKPLVGDRSPEARKAAKARLAEERRKAREGMAAGDERYLTVRDRGPQRKLARDVVDSRFTAGELVMPLLVIVIFASLIDNPAVVLTITAITYVLFAAIAIDGWLVGRKVQKRLVAKYGADKVERGVRWYAAMRSIQMRALRLPKPQVKRGEQI